MMHSCQHSLTRVDACTLFQSKCSTYIVFALTAGCASTPSCALSAKHTEPVHFSSSCGSSEVLKLAVHQFASYTLLGMAELKMS